MQFNETGMPGSDPALAEWSGLSGVHGIGLVPGANPGSGAGEGPGPDPWVVEAARRALRHVAALPSFASSASLTAGVTKRETSPPSRAISLTSFDAIA